MVHTHTHVTHMQATLYGTHTGTHTNTHMQAKLNGTHTDNIKWYTHTGTHTSHTHTHTHTQATLIGIFKALSGVIWCYNTTTK